jgi:hypothetical protein
LVTCAPLGAGVMAVLLMGAVVPAWTTPLPIPDCGWLFQPTPGPAFIAGLRVPAGIVLPGAPIIEEPGFVTG